MTKPRRNARQQADDFIAANDRSPVIQGKAIEPGGAGCYYQLENLSWHRLGAEACKLLPEGYPKWRFS